MVVVVLVDDADAERLSVSESAIINTVDIEVGQDFFVPTGPKEYVDFLQSIEDFTAIMLVVNH
jgi:hypothetical protein